MRNGEIQDYEEKGWCASMGYRMHKRSSIYKSYDEWANNLVPYGWDVEGTTLFGQNVTHWAYFNTPEQYKEQRIKELQQEIDKLHHQMESDEFFKDKILPNVGFGYLAGKDDKILK